MESPVDVSSIFDNPCSQLTPEELSGLQIDRSGKQRSYLGDSECEWTSRSGAILSLAVDRDRDLLVDTYRARLLPVFRPVEIVGYPAVREATSVQSNNCIVTVGLGPKQALRSDWTGLGTFEPGDPDPCERAETAAALVIRKLPPQR